MTGTLAPAFFVSLVLLGIHSYFGLRIIKRNIIFTDLAIGQMAALGAAVSLLFFQGENVYPLSLAGSLMAAGLIAHFSRRVRNLEAVIGLIYALGLSGVFILLAKSPHGMEEFRNLMAYDILFTDTGDIWSTAMFYLAVGGVILIYERYAKGFLNEMLFFLCFALTVTSSVRLSGVLVVFAILLAPAFIAIRIASIFGRGEELRFTLPAAWVTGTALNTAALLISFNWDLPTGYTIVFVNATAAVITAFFGNGAAAGSGNDSSG